MKAVLWKSTSAFPNSSFEVGITIPTNYNPIQEARDRQEVIAKQRADKQSDEAGPFIQPNVGIERIVETEKDRSPVSYGLVKGECFRRPGSGVSQYAASGVTCFKLRITSSGVAVRWWEKLPGCQLGCVVLGVARISFLPSFLPIYTHMYLSTCLPLLSLFWRVYRLYNALTAYPATRVKRIVLSHARWLYLEAHLLRSSAANIAFVSYIVLM